MPSPPVVVVVTAMPVTMITVAPAMNDNRPRMVNHRWRVVIDRRGPVNYDWRRMVDRRRHMIDGSVMHGSGRIVDNATVVMPASTRRAGGCPDGATDYRAVASAEGLADHGTDSSANHRADDGVRGPDR